MLSGAPRGQSWLHLVSSVVLSLVWLSLSRCHASRHRRRMRGGIRWVHSRLQRRAGTSCSRHAEDGRFSLVRPRAVRGAVRKCGWAVSRRGVASPLNPRRTCLHAVCSEGADESSVADSRVGRGGFAVEQRGVVDTIFLLVVRVVVVLYGTMELLVVGFIAGCLLFIKTSWPGHDSPLL